MNLSAIVQKYNNKERICGSVDCNLMILELYEPKMYTALVDQYSTIKEGIKKAKKLVGYRSIKEILEKSGNYEKVPNGFSSVGDIGCTLDSNCTFLHLGNCVFLVQTINDKEIFTVLDTIKIDKNKTVFYRRK